MREGWEGLGCQCLIRAGMALPVVAATLELALAEWLDGFGTDAFMY